MGTTKTAEEGRKKLDSRYYRQLQDDALHDAAQARIGRWSPSAFANPSSTTLSTYHCPACSSPRITPCLMSISRRTGVLPTSFAASSMDIWSFVGMASSRSFVTVLPRTCKRCYMTHAKNLLYRGKGRLQRFGRGLRQFSTIVPGCKAAPSLGSGAGFSCIISKRPEITHH